MKAVIYARYSPRRDPRQTGGGKIESAETQIARCRSYCRANDYRVIAVHRDDMLSGRSVVNRPGLAAAIADARSHKAVFVVYALSRLARHTRDALEIAEQLQSAGAHLAVLDMHVDTTTPIGRCFYTIAAAFDQLERERIAQRTRDAMLRLQADGRRMSKQPPYGWEIDPASAINEKSKNRVPSGLRENPAEQEVIHQIVNLHSVDKMGLRAIARYLKSHGVQCRGNGFHHHRIQAILRRWQAANPASGPRQTIE